MLSWRNVREGEDFLRVSTDGRFVIRRIAVQEVDGFFSYEVSDCHVAKTETAPTLQAAHKLAMEWETE